MRLVRWLDLLCKAIRQKRRINLCLQDKTVSYYPLHHIHLIAMSLPMAPPKAIICKCLPFNSLASAVFAVFAFAALRS